MSASRFAAWAGAPTAERVTGVTRVTERANPSVSVALEADAEVTRAMEPRVTGVTAPRPSATKVTQVTQSATPGFTRKLIADQCSNPGNLSNPQKEQCATSIDAAADPVWWRALFEQRAALRRFNGGRLREEAEVVAFSDTILGIIATVLVPTHSAAPAAVTNWAVRPASRSATEPESISIARAASIA
jgi:hypothetical protein